MSTLKPYAKVVKILEKAKDDNDKLAALLLLTKSLKADELNSKEKRKIFKAIGFRFPYRLMSDISGGDIDRADMFNIGICIFASFLPVKGTLSPAEVEKVAERCVEFLDTVSEPQTTDLSSIYEIGKILRFLAYSSDGAEDDAVLAAPDTLATICKATTMISDEEEIHLEFVELLVSVLSKHGDLWRRCRSHVLDSLQSLVILVRGRHDSRKFELIETLSKLFRSFDSSDSACRCEYNGGAWLNVLTADLRDVLLSKKLTAAQRNPTLNLISELVRCFGLGSVLPQKENAPRHAAAGVAKYNVLLIRLVCIELSDLLWNVDPGVEEVGSHLRHFAERLQENFAAIDSQLLASCLQLYEAYCSNIADFDQDNSDAFMNFEDICATQESLEQVAQLLARLVKWSTDNNMQTTTAAQGEQQQQQPMFSACFRALASWLNVEYFAASCARTGSDSELVPAAFIGYVKKNLKGGGGDLGKIVGPVIMNFCDIDSVLLLMKEEAIFNVLCRQMCSTTGDGDDDEMTYCVLAQSLIALATQDAFSSSSSSSVFIEMLLQQSLLHRDNSVRFFHVSALLLILLNKVSPSSRKSLNAVVKKSVDEFFASLLVFLQLVHSTNGVAVFISKRYESSCSRELEALWPMVMKELTMATHNQLFDVNMYMQTGFITKSAALLKVLDQKKNGQQQPFSELKHCYSMLCAAVAK